MAASSNRRLAPSSGKLTTAHEDSDDTVCISLFSHIQLEGVPASTYEHKINQINSQIETNEFDTDAEFIQAYNLMTFCFWMVRKKSEAVEYNEKALQINAENIIALGNKAWIHENRLEHSKAEPTRDIIRGIKAEKGQIDPFLISQTEIAYAYSRFGPEFAQTAMDIYTRVLQHVQLTGDHVDVCRWKYEKALAARRLAHYYLCGSNKDDIVILQLFKESFALVNEVIRETPFTRLKARSWAMLGEITQIVNFRFRETNMKNQHFFPDDLKISPAHMLHNALQTDRRDCRVLETCARVYRYLRMRDEAIECFQKSNEICETTLSHHHLALTLLAKKKEGLSGKPREKSSTFRNRVGFRPRRNFKVHQANVDMPCNDQGSRLKNVRSYILRCPKFSNNYKLPSDAETRVILDHFNKSVEMSPVNHAALKDLGDFYGCLGDYEKAKEHYIQTIHSEVACSPSMLVTCYEQIGFCHLQLSETASSGEVENNHNLDAIHCFFKAVETCASAANKELMGTVWKSLPTLHELLHSRYNDPRKKKKLADLYDRLGHYKEAIFLYLDIPGGDKMNIDICKRLINTYIHDDNFDKALYLLNILKCSQESASIESGVYVKAYIEGALQSYLRNDISDAKLRFMDALFHSRKEQSESNKSDALIIISDEVAEIQGVQDITKLLSQVCGLKVTSTDDITPGQDLLIEFGRLANATHQQIICLDKSSNDKYFREMIRRSSQEDLPPILVIKLDKTDTPESLRIHHSIEYHMSNNEENDDGKSTEKEYAHKSRNVSREVDFLKKVFYIMCGLNEF